MADTNKGIVLAGPGHRPVLGAQGGRQQPHRLAGPFHLCGDPQVRDGHRAENFDRDAAQVHVPFGGAGFEFPGKQPRWWPEVLAVRGPRPSRVLRGREAAVNKGLIERVWHYCFPFVDAATPYSGRYNRSTTLDYDERNSNGGSQ